MKRIIDRYYMKKRAQKRSAAGYDIGGECYCEDQRCMRPSEKASIVERQKRDYQSPPGQEEDWALLLEKDPDYPAFERKRDDKRLEQGKDEVCTEVAEVWYHTTETGSWPICKACAEAGHMGYGTGMFGPCPGPDCPGCQEEEFDPGQPR